MRYAGRKKFRFDFELGNEPNSFQHKYNHTVSPVELVKDYRKLRRLLAKYPRYRNSFLIGPSVTQPNKKHTITFLRKYYINGRTATASDFMNMTILDSIVPEIKTAVKLTRKFQTGAKKQIWLGETASAYGGGAPKLSDSYIAGFMWLDKLGLAAKLGLDAVIRQSFYRGHYALLNRKTEPNPDYWLSLIYKKIVPSGVLKAAVKSYTVNNTHLRFYAHCNKKSVTFYGMNLGNKTIGISFDKIKGKIVTEYLFEPPDGNLTSKSVLLNGQLLRFDEKSTVFPPLDGSTVFPPLDGRRVKQPVLLKPKRFAFYTLPYYGAC